MQDETKNCCKQSQFVEAYAEPLRGDFDGRRIGKAVGFWQKNKSWLIPAIAAGTGLFGGNIDRVDDFIPNLPKVQDVDQLKADVKELQDIVKPEFQRSYSK
jgi:hypothetical protein